MDSSPGSPPVPIDLSLQEALSGIAGSISLVSWIVLLLPQLIENYKNGRADALSVIFLVSWLVGDMANLIGAIWGGLLPTIIAIAVYFCFADLVLLSQTVYYNKIEARRAHKHITAGSRRRHSILSAHNDPLAPLLGDHHHHHHRRRRSSARRGSFRRRDSLTALLSEDVGQHSEMVRNVLCLLGVMAAGTLGWVFAWWTGAWTAQEGGTSETEMPLGAEVLGYISAALYMTARIPQIIRNHRKKSCEGLSLLFFLLSLLGNVSYGAGILLHSTEKSYVVDNLPWLVGSLGTMAEDIVIFTQFHIYSASAGQSAVVEDEENDHAGAVRRVTTVREV